MNQNEFLIFIEPIKDKMYRLSLRLLVSKEAAKDAVQEVFVKLWNKKDKLKDYDNPHAFAITVTKNHCLDQLKLKNNNNLSIVHNNYEDESKSVQKHLEAKNELELVAEILKGLSQQEQTLIQLKDVEQLEYDEIIAITGMKPTAIRVALSRARKKIRKEILKKHHYGTV
ncbi:sigma-70 family RNA polymerase sigma factor [Mesonia sp. JHPTF-M18]|uniref:Sigma-70 family RNA polymerase sigma factor n=2 Tax=Mesonia aestuariivivens TaxID=2796128 RepID=A0ABS6VYE8_9FLAO|nr:sigma-70 family RNA polymerase sigma factor [Mesonia aestuariivivens]MBW2960606.1 sigma-70 family RNA polymerase sigma factor [Mesonia aestuariivivens]